MKFNSSKAVVAWILLLVLAASFFLIGLGGLPFIDRDEGEYAAAAMEMVQRGDYIIPHVNNRPYFEKPPLFFWLMALSFETLGYNEAAGRLPSALAGLAVTLLICWFARRRDGDALALPAGLMTVSSLLMVMMSRIALLDSLLTLFTTMTMFFYFEGERAAATNRKGWWHQAAWASMSLAFMTKGPVGVAAPLAAVFFFTLFNRDLFAAVIRSKPIQGLFIFVLISGPWYVAAFFREGGDFWRGFFISQNVTRFTQVLLGHGAPLWFYLPVLAVMVWPWFFFAFSPAWRVITQTNAPIRRNVPMASLDAFLATWLLAELLLFSVAATKQPNYILPAVPAVILLSARWWSMRLRRYSDVSSGKWALRLSLLVGLALAAFFLGVDHLLPMALEKARAGINPDSFEYAFTASIPNLGIWLKIMGGVILAGCGAAWLLFRFGRITAAFTIFCLAGLMMIFGLGFQTVPRALDYLQTPARTLALESRELMNSDDPLAAYGLYKPTLWFYSGRPILRIMSHDTTKLNQYLSREQRVYLLSRKILLPELKANTRFRLLDERGGYLLGDNGGRP